MRQMQFHTLVENYDELKSLFCMAFQYLAVMLLKKLNTNSKEPHEGTILGIIFYFSIQGVFLMVVLLSVGHYYTAQWYYTC